MTPVLRAPLSRDHLAAISAVTADGRLFTHLQRDAFRGPAIVAFLRQLLRQVRGKLLVIWDGAPIHHCQPVTDFLAAGAARRLHLERLPSYAPELNPDEGIWNHLKRVELANRCCVRTWTNCAGSWGWPFGVYAARHICSEPASASVATFTNLC